MAVKVEVRSEIGTSREPAKVLVYEDDRLVAEVIAEVELKQGADSGWYHCVTLKKQEQKLVVEDGRVYQEVMPGVLEHRRDLEDTHDFNI